MMYVKLRRALSICDTWPAFFAMKSSYMRSHPGDCASAAPAPALWPRVVLCISISPFLSNRTAPVVVLSRGWACVGWGGNDGAAVVGWARELLSVGGPRLWHVRSRRRFGLG